MANIRARLAEGLEQDNLLSVVRGIFKGEHYEFLIAFYIVFFIH